MIITSSKNEQVKWLKGLTQRKNRDAEGCFFVEGLRGVAEGMESGFKLRKLAVTEAFSKTPSFAAFAKNADPAQIIIMSAGVFVEICETETPQGVAAVFEIPQNVKIGGDCIIMLENLRDPGNMGTVIRTADAAGMSGVICGKGCVDVYNQKVIRSTAGSIFHIPVLRFEDLDSVEIAEGLKKKGYRLYAAHPRGDVSCFDERFEGKCVIIIGNEANGISDSLLERCDSLLTIPMPGRAESLNASVAAALLIYEITRKKGFN